MFENPLKMNVVGCVHVCICQKLKQVLLSIFPTYFLNFFKNPPLPPKHLVRPPKHLVRGLFFFTDQALKKEHVSPSPISTLRAKSQRGGNTPPPSILDKNSTIGIGLNTAYPVYETLKLESWL